MARADRTVQSRPTNASDRDTGSGARADRTVQSRPTNASDRNTGSGARTDRTVQSRSTNASDRNTGSGARADRMLVVACGALARELRRLIAALDRGRLEGHGRGTDAGIDLECLPAKLHNRPERIPEAVRRRVRAARGHYRSILVGYADCGTGGLLDKVCREEGVERLPGPHCYQLYAGAEAFSRLQEQEPGTFYLTDYLVRHFDRLILEGLGLHEHPELEELYFGNYTRVVHLVQEPDPELGRLARRAADRLGLCFETVTTGYGDLAEELVRIRGWAA